MRLCRSLEIDEAEQMSTSKKDFSYGVNYLPCRDIHHAGVGFRLRKIVAPFYDAIRAHEYECVTWLLAGMHASQIQRVISFRGLHGRIGSERYPYAPLLYDWLKFIYGIHGYCDELHLHLR